MDRTRYRIPEVDLRKRASDVTAPRAAIKDPEGAVQTLREILIGREVESMIVLYLDSRHKIIGWTEAARGSLNAVHIAPREILRGALLAGAAAIIVSHNHPSGDPTPSRDDNDLTARLREACTLVGIPMLDHIIIADEGHYSYASAGR